MQRPLGPRSGLQKRQQQVLESLPDETLHVGVVRHWSAPLARTNRLVRARAKHLLLARRVYDLAVAIVQHGRVLERGRAARIVVHPSYSRRTRTTNVAPPRQKSVINNEISLRASRENFRGTSSQTRHLKLGHVIMSAKGEC